jgi:hypothetical protein
VGLSYITMKNILSVIAATVAVTVLAQSVSAAPAVKRFTRYVDGLAQHDIAIVGQTPSTAVSILSLNDWVDRKVIADACGMAKHSPTTKYPVNQIITAASGLNSSSHNQDIAGLPVQTIPTCNKATGLLSEPRTADFKTTDGTIVKIDGPLGLTTVYYEKRKSVKANAAGIVNLKDTYIDEFRIGTVDYDISTMPTTNAFPIGRKSNGTVIVYVPAPTN